MLQINTHHLFASLTYLASSQKFFALMRRKLIEEGRIGQSEPRRFVEMCAAAARLKAIADALDMPASSGCAERIMAETDRLGPFADHLTAEGLNGLIDEISTIISCFHDEMGARLLFVLPQRQARHYSDEPHFGQEVDDAFPSAAPEIVEASKCRALGRWTASVMHLMRALEVGLGALATFAGVNSNENWNTLLGQIEANLKKVGKKSHSAADEQFAAEAATHFRAIKNAWRNHAMHAREKYDEERAVAIYDSVRSFMRHLATRLSE